MFRYIVLSLPFALATVSRYPANSIYPASNYPNPGHQYPAPAPSSVQSTAHVYRPGQVAVPAYPVSAGVRLVRPAAPASRVTPTYADISYPAIPFEFDYAVNSVDGSHSRRERGDGAGRVSGSYTIQLADGRSRTVEYVADEAGYRANIRTNEFGTENQSPADVVLQSSAIPAKQAALQGERDPTFRQFGPAHHKA